MKTAKAPAREETGNDEQIKQQIQAAFDQEKVLPVKQHEAALSLERAKLSEQLQAAYSSQQQALVQQHEQDMAEAKKMTARHDNEQKQFKFTVRGHETLELSGSVPSQIFESEPNSILNKTYNGEWAYAKDDQGRACINSKPAHWPLIMDWLSFGAVPSPTLCTSTFIAECKYWQLDNLLATIEQQKSSLFNNPSSDEHSIKLTQIAQDSQKGFNMQARIHRFIQRFAACRAVETAFAAYGASWTLMISERGAFLNMVTGPTLKRTIFSISFGDGPDQWLFCQGDPSNAVDFVAAASNNSGWGGYWLTSDKGEIVQTCPYVDLQGSLLVTVRVLFAQAS